LPGIVELVGDLPANSYCYWWLVSGPIAIGIDIARLRKDGNVSIAVDMPTDFFWQSLKRGEILTLIESCI
jgi:hypothetical protein